MGISHSTSTQDRTFVLCSLSSDHIHWLSMVAQCCSSSSTKQSPFKITLHILVSTVCWWDTSGMGMLEDHRMLGFSLRCFLCSRDMEFSFPCNVRYLPFHPCCRERRVDTHIVLRTELSMVCYFSNRNLILVFMRQNFCEITWGTGGWSFPSLDQKMFCTALQKKKT